MARRAKQYETLEFDLQLSDLPPDARWRESAHDALGLAGAWSLAFYQHRSAPDGMIYPSRLNGHTNLAVYDRAVPKRGAARTLPLIGAADLAAVLRVNLA